MLEGRERKGGPWITVIGISDDLVQSGEDPAEPPTVFLPIAHDPLSIQALMLRASGDPGALAGELRSLMQKVDPDLPLFSVEGLTAARRRQH